MIKSIIYNSQIVRASTFYGDRVKPLVVGISVRWVKRANARACERVRDCCVGVCGLSG